MDPIIRLCKAAASNEVEKVTKMAKAIGVQLNTEDLARDGKDLMKRVFQKWINAADALLEMIILKLPSPIQAQKYRTAYLYEGPIDDPSAQAMANCDPDGPLMIFISKMVPTKGQSRFYAFGRVFSGTIVSGQKVRIQGPNYVPGSKTDLNIKNIQ